MNSLVIVAIPSDQDRIWKLSSEKVPHMTLLFLGEEENPEVSKIVQFVQHATQLSEHGPIYLDVDHRGELGDDQADVLFFSKRSWNLKWIKSFRAQLLQNEAVRKAYDSTEQFPDWTPHLTLGYPETPAKKLDEDRSIYAVEFDRIAVWTGDSEGPEFRLEWPEREEDMGQAWSQQGESIVAGLLKSGTKEIDEEHDPETASQLVSEGEQFLEHYGVRGMRWGVRNSGTPTAVAPQATSQVPSGTKRKTKIETKGGENQPASPDAIKVAQARVKLYKSGPSALSNQELRELTTRIQLEQQAVQVTRSAASKFVRDILGQQGKQAANQAVRTQVEKQSKKG